MWSRLGDEEGAQPGPAADGVEQNNLAPARASEKVLMHCTLVCLKVTTCLVAIWR